MELSPSYGRVNPKLRWRPLALWRRSRGSTFWALTLLALAPPLWLLLHGAFNILVTGLFLVVLGTAMWLDATLSIVFIFYYLFILGDIRRIAGVVVGYPKLDTLILIGPILTAALAIPILLKIRLRDSLSKLVLALTIVMVLEVFNPRQGGVTVGLAGALMYLVPLLWFWIGQKYGSPQLLSKVIYRTLIPIAVLAAIIGICQTYVGFLPWNRIWIDTVAVHYTSLNLGGGNIRSFGFSVGAAEYINLLLLGTVCLAISLFARRRSLAVALPLVATALFLASSRGAIFRLLLALAVSWALGGKRGRGWAYRLPIGLAIGAGALVLVLSKAGGGDASTAHISSSQAATQHQLNGLAHPLDKKYSTLGIHAAEFTVGIRQAFAYPIGNGLGSTTIGAGKFGSQGDTFAGTEVDLGDVFLSSGVLGGLLYLAIIILVCRRAIGFARETPREIGLPVPAMLASLGGVWLLTGQYSIIPFTWFLIGAMTWRPSAGQVSALDRRRLDRS